jgi:hypothetical protein
VLLRDIVVLRVIFVRHKAGLILNLESIEELLKPGTRIASRLSFGSMQVKARMGVKVFATRWHVKLRFAATSLAMARRHRCVVARRGIVRIQRLSKFNHCIFSAVSYFAEGLPTILTGLTR